MEVFIMKYDVKRALADFIVNLENEKLEGEVAELYEKANDILLNEEDYCKLIEFARDYRDHPLDYISHFC
jgi:hypothetical protein